MASPTTAAQMTETPSDYIGTYVDDNPTDSTDPKKYTWSRFRGQDGNKGEQGTPGINGKDGKTYYLHIKYSNDGTTFTSNNGEDPGAWLGQYVDTTEADSTTFSRYTWSKIRGDDGANASYVNITTTSQVFLLPKGSTSYTPSTIKLTPTFTNSTYSKWQYSTNNGSSWTNVTSGSNGLTISSSVLTIANTCNLFTSSVKSLQFKVTGTNGATDTMTVIRVEDGVDGNDGATGANGTSATNVQLSNENHTFQATSDGKAVVNSITVNIYGYTGTTLKSVTIGDIVGTPTGMTVTKNNSGSTSASLSIATTTSMTTKNGTITIPLTCNGVTFNKIFTYSLAVPGTNGTNGTNASYVTAEPTTLFFKKGSHETSYSPSTITITPVFTNCAYNSWQYSKDGGSSWTTVTSGNNGLTISSYKLTIANTSSLFTDSVTSIAFKVLSTNGKSDVVTISRLSDGVNGKGVKTITNYYLASSSSSGITTSTSGWTTTVQNISTSKKYLWNYELITYTDNSNYTTTPTIIGVHGTNGKGISSITEYYLATSSSSGVTTSSSGWTTTVQSMTSTNKYLWNYEVIRYTDNSTTTGSPKIIGVYGEKGTDGAAGKDSVNILLSNENHTFAASSSGSAVATTVTTNVIGYVGTKQTACTIGNISGLPRGMTASIGSNGSTAANVTFTATTSLNTKNGVVSIPVTCGGVTITKYFTYSLAIAGTNGSNSVIMKINATTNVFKSNDGGVTFSPSTITLSYVAQHCTFSKWQYSTNGGSSWTDVVSGNNGLTISSNSLKIAQSSSLYNTTVTTVTFRAMSTTSNIYDTLTVYKLYDRTDINDAFEQMKLTVTQSNTKWEAAFKNSNANNMLLNSDFKTGTTDDWISNGGGISVTKANSFPFYGSTEYYLKTSFPGGVRYAHDVQLEPNTDYVFEGYLYVNSTMTGSETVPMYIWTWTGTTP